MPTPPHPQGKRIDRMLWEFRQTKEIESDTRAYRSLIQGRCTRLGLKRHLITEEERRFLLQRRKDQGLIG